MKTFIFIFLAIFLSVSSVAAKQPAEKVSVGYGTHAVTKNGRITVKFLELVEDSRCPEGVNCVWAGVAKIKIRLSKNGKSSDFELNTNQRDKPALFQGYSFTLKNLSPYPSTTAKYSQSAYRATIEVAKAKK